LRVLSLKKNIHACALLLYGFAALVYKILFFL
jgi:hypothetical protein